MRAHRGPLITVMLTNFNLLERQGRANCKNGRFKDSMDTSKGKDKAAA